MSRFLKRFYTVLMFLFLYAPIFVLVIFSFNSSKSNANWESFTLDWYIQLFRDRNIMKALYYTLTVALISSVGATIIGTAAAIGIHQMKAVPKRIMLNINNLPVLNPDIVTGVAMMTLFQFIRLDLGLLRLLIAHITFNIPYVILSVLPKLRQMPKNIVEASLDLGATPFYALRKVVIPEILPGIISGALIAFTLSVDDFVISFFTTGKGVTNLSIVIFSMAKRGINPKINALSALMFTTVLILLLVINIKDLKSKKTERNSTTE